MLKTHTRLLRETWLNTLAAVARGSERPFAYKKVLYLIGLKYTISFLFGQNQELTQDLLIEKHG